MKVLFNIGEVLVLEKRLRDVKKTRRRTVGKRVLSDELRRELEVEIG